MVNLQIRLDDKLKLEAQAVAEALGMEVATAVRIFLCQMVRDKALPFTPSMHTGSSSKPIASNREEWIQRAMHKGLEALDHNDYASEEEMKHIFREAGANVS